MLDQGRSGRAFTAAARTRAAEVRREIAELSKGDSLSAFVVREPMPGKGYRWEIRRYGGLLVERSPFTFTDGPEAGQAGERALATLRTRASHK